MTQCFPEPYERSGGNVNVKIDLSSNETKTDLKSATGADTSKLTVKSDLASR